MSECVFPIPAAPTAMSRTGDRGRKIGKEKSGSGCHITLRSQSASFILGVAEAVLGCAKSLKMTIGIKVEMIYFLSSLGENEGIF